MLAQSLNTFILALTAVAAAPAETDAELSIRMSGFRSDDGQVLVAVFRGAEGFPGDPGKAWKTAVARVTRGQARVDLAVPTGEYAFAVVHDENGNNAMDTNWVGIPKEGFAASNNAKGRFGPPKYRDAKFRVGADGAIQRVVIQYF
ncbi:Uncharacterized conserved protein, DUF2141 family [Nannocystis exedens]|uniref:Uncharacterized conserved protein, DUF2141 family n=1 Tax=Nannocystis exedens TaxID=54 RepID=A0A1I2ADQ8_9BACT|nr:DUF2141 domain-containing protein [Nannocystis exedens]PCC69785.1 hypothetical protein NAEX_02811 [Nannocystis exedens]SFE42135.1 Uncharacterized conserved protein, DUF2141 family [Nannocystis exedens]